MSFPNILQISQRFYEQKNFLVRIIYQMFTLITEKSRFFRVKRGQSGEDIEKFFISPVNGKTFAGRIIEISPGLSVYTAAVGDTYRTLAKKLGADEDALKNINCGKPVYPTCKIFYPRKKP